MNLNFPYSKILLSGGVSGTKIEKAYEEKKQIIVELFKEEQTAYSLSKITNIPISNIKLYLSEFERYGYLKSEGRAENSKFKKYYSIKEEYKLLLIELIPELRFEDRALKGFIKEQIIRNAIECGLTLFSKEINQKQMKLFTEETIKFYKALFSPVSRIIEDALTINDSTIDNYTKIELIPYAAMYEAIRLTYMYSGIPFLKEQLYSDVGESDKEDKKIFDEINKLEDFKIYTPDYSMLCNNGLKLFEYMKKRGEINLE